MEDYRKHMHYYAPCNITRNCNKHSILEPLHLQYLRQQSLFIQHYQVLGKRPKQLFWSDCLSSVLHYV